MRLACRDLKRHGTALGIHQARGSCSSGRRVSDPCRRIRHFFLGAGRVLVLPRAGVVDHLGRMLVRKLPIPVIVTVANKIVRIVWALLTKCGMYRALAATA